MGKSVIAFMILPMILSCQYMSWPDDNIVEEHIEDFIQQETGVKIDLTGDSPES